MSRSVTLVVRAAQSWCRWMAFAGRRCELLVRLEAAMLLCVGGLCAGCTEVSIARARHQIAAGDYTAAHDYFATEAAKSDQLSPRQRRLVMDGLCLLSIKSELPPIL
jgi:hypothetical protein